MEDILSFLPNSISDKLCLLSQIFYLYQMKIPVRRISLRRVRRNLENNFPRILKEEIFKDYTGTLKLFSALNHLNRKNYLSNKSRRTGIHTQLAIITGFLLINVLKVEMKWQPQYFPSFSFLFDLRLKYKFLFVNSKSAPNFNTSL